MFPVDMFDFRNYAGNNAVLPEHEWTVPGSRLSIKPGKKSEDIYSIFLVY